MILRRQSEDRVGPAERSRSSKRFGTPWRIKVLARAGLVGRAGFVRAGFVRAGFVRAGFVRADFVRTSTGVAAMTEADLGTCGQGRGVEAAIGRGGA
jgi:hypothetical protein